ncbi:MAG: N-acetylmuramoyl-L-alanine amidase, partial [Oscillibacter sp.]|nr:N-acetylmuramoyl-L-alanine amidase [Oscillibacter sp.]
MLRKPIILIDNGHGIDTPGKRSPDGLFREYRYAREIACGLCDCLQALGETAFLLVKEENDISLEVQIDDCTPAPVGQQEFDVVAVVLEQVFSQHGGTKGFPEDIKSGL